MCCDAERKKYDAKRDAKARDRAANPEKYRASDELFGKLARGMLKQDGLDDDAINRHIEGALAQERREAEYYRRFPNGPVPDFTARRGNPDDMALLKHFAGADTLRRIYANGRTPEADAEMTRLLEEARLIQAARQVLCPNADDRKAEQEVATEPVSTQA